MTSWNPITARNDRAATPAPETTAPARHPLGFSDVREPAAPEAPTDRAPIGFSPDLDTTPPSYRTELSFRRQPRVQPAPPAVDLDVPPTALPIVPAPAPAAAEPSTVPVFEDPDAAWTPQASAEGEGESVPFYKREITFRRRKDDEHEPDETPAEPEQERGPFGFGFDAGDAATHEPEPEPEQEVEVLAVEETEQPPGEPAPPATEPDPVQDEEALPVAETTPEDEPSDDAPAEPVSEPVITENDAVAPAPTETRGRRSFRARPGGKPSAKRSRARGGRSSGPIVGLKIGASQLAAAVVTDADGGHQLVSLARTPLESGIVVDGEVRDASALAHALRSFFDEHKLPKRDVRIGLASNRIGVRTFEMSGIDDDEKFDNAVRFKAHEVLPVSVHESVLDYRIVDERASETGDPIRRVFLVVAPRDQVEPYLDVCQDAGLRLGGIDLEALGLLRAFVPPQPFSSRTADDTATVVVAIGHEVTTLLVAGGGSCEFTRVFDWGGGTLQSAIAQELDVHPAEAATVLRHLTLSGEPKALASIDDEARAKALEAVRGRLTPFARELVASLQFYQTQDESLGIGEIVLTGGTSHLVGLADALHQMIGVSVRVGDPLQRVVSPVAIDPDLEATIGSLAVPIGLAIDDDALRSVNLIPRDLVSKERRAPNLVKIIAPVAVAVPLAALAFAFVSANGTVSDRESELSAVRAEIASLPEPKRPQIDPSLAASEAQRASALAGVLGGRISWDGVLRDVSRVLPGSVSLTRLAAQLPAPVTPTDPAAQTTSSADAALPVAPTGVQIEGYTGNQPAVARLIARLRTVPSLTNVQLQSSTQEEVGDNVVVRFVVLADMVGGAS
jgi:type IV pilus assembly protein PilM